jgi:ABC-type Mn2+/Zn2+ transport system ATPase subunit
MIKWHDLAFYRGDKLILDSISGQLAKGELVLLSGINGSGKTTLLNLIGGALLPSSGTLTLNGKELQEIRIQDQAKIRSIAPQNRTFNMGFKVRELLNLQPANRKALSTDEIIEELGVVEILDSSILELSLGQQQKVSLAITLIQEADFYLLDEPFSAQDATSVRRILRLLQEVAKTKGLMVVSHNTDHLDANFDREIKLS